MAKDLYEAAEKILHDALVIVDGVRRKHKGKVRVKRIVIGLGELSHLKANDLAETLSALIEDSPLESSEMEVVTTPGVVECICGFVGKPNVFEVAEGKVVAECPKCRKIELLVHEGKGVEVKEIELG
ncbi:MAG: hydrogenase/urease maturation nickel metallochaperone HypA [archaeon]